MRQAWVDQRLQYENILNQRKDLKSETEIINKLPKEIWSHLLLEYF